MPRPTPAKPVPYRNQKDRVIARIMPSRLGRAVAASLMGSFAALMLLGALGESDAPSALARLGFLGAGIGLLWLAFAVWQATAAGLVLTEVMLCDTNGRVLAQVADIVAVRRGLASFRPANGFALTMAAHAPASWAPGLWWRVGRRVGVGGLVARREAAEMAEALVFLVAARAP